MNIQIVLMVLVLCVKFYADSEELNRMNNNIIRHRSNRRKLLQFVPEIEDCKKGTRLYRDKCRTEEEIIILEKTDSDYDYGDDDKKGQTNITDTELSTSGGNNLLNKTGTGTTSKTTSSTSNREFSTSGGDNEEKRQTNVIIRTDINSTPKSHEFNDSRINSTLSNSEHVNKSHTTTHEYNVPHKSKVFKGDQAPTSSAPNDEVSTPEGDDDNKTSTKVINKTSIDSTPKRNESIITKSNSTLSNNKHDDKTKTATHDNNVPLVPKVLEDDLVSTSNPPKDELSTPVGDDDKKTQTKVINKTSDESNDTKSSSTLSNSEHENKPKTATHDNNVSLVPKIIEGDQPPLSTLNIYVIVISALGGFAFLIFCIWLYYNKCYRSSSYRLVPVRYPSSAEQ